MADTSTIQTDFHARVMREFDTVVVAVQEERALCLQDRRFVDIAGAMWEGPWYDQMENSIMVEIDKTSQGVEKIIGDYRANRTIVNYRGVGKGADEETADLMDGMFRADFYVSGGQGATDNAFEDAVKGGMGAWRLVTVYYDERDPDDDRQRAAFEMIVDPEMSVFWDPNSKKEDKSDAKWCIIITAKAKAAYEAEHPGKCTSFPDGIVKPIYDWYTPDVIKVAEYYEIEVKKYRRYTLVHAASGEERKDWAEDLEPGQLDDLQTQGWKLVKTRMVERQRVKKSLLNGAEVLEEPRYIAGSEIPVVMVYGKRSFIDNMERVRGHVRKAKDPQRVLNMQISKLTETEAAAPIERPIFDPEQIQGYEQQWADGNRNRAAFAIARALRNADGSIAHIGPIGKVQPPEMSQVSASLIQVTSAAITEITAGDDGAATVQSNVSADAMEIAAQRTDAKSVIYIDNMKKAWVRCGQIWQAMYRDGLVVEGDEVEVMSSDDSPELSTAVIAEPFTDEKGYRIRNDISKGSYHVIVDVTPATATQRDRTVKNCVNAASVVGAFDPELASALVTTAILNMDGEGTGDLQGWTRKRALVQGLVKPTPEEQREMEEAAAQQQQQPDPQAEYLLAGAEKQRADAAKATAGVAQAEADTELKLAQAEKTRAEAAGGAAETRMGIVDRVRSMFGRPSAAGPLKDGGSNDQRRQPGQG